MIDLLTGQNMKLYYLNDQNKAYTKMENLEVGFNLFIARIADMNSMTQSEMKGNMDIQTLTPRTDS
jgi:hypothetical protein